nr:HTH domain-containing protein [Erysipelotrichaceae bacterium]
MRKNRSKDILDLFIQNSKSDYSAEELSDRFGVSPRMIRNYIRQLNEGSETILFENGRFRLDPEYERKEDENHPDLSPEDRVSVIISKLLTDQSDTDIYDLADELFVSEATIEADLKKVRRRIERFDLTLANENGRLSIRGSEKNKRSLTSYMITNTRYKGFMFNDSRRFLNDEYQISFIKDNLIAIFNECYFFYNDYSLNNIILHIIITIDRLKNDCAIQETQFNVNISEIEQQAADRISAFLEENYDITISQSERNNIASFLSCNLATLDY